MEVSHYFEWERLITGGHAQSVRNQRSILDDRGIDYTTRPDLSADVLHLNNMGPRSVYYARRARARGGPPVVVHAHQTAEDFRDSFALSNVLAAPMRPYLEYAYSLADRLVCPSEYNARTVATYSARPRTVLSNGFDPDRLAGHDDPALRREYLDRYDLEPPVVFAVGHVIERKGLPAFVETARRLPGVDFAWFGYVSPTGGRLGRALTGRRTRELIDAAPGNCTFTGYVDDVRGAYAAGDVFFFPTRNENEGMALLEAMSCGAPPVLRDIPTFERYADGEDCLKATDPAGFADAIRRLVEDPDLRARVGESARRRSEAYTLSAVGDRLLNVYREVTGDADGDGRAGTGAGGRVPPPSPPTGGG